MKNDKEKGEFEFKEPVPRRFVPTELGSGVFANVGGRPTDEEYLILNQDSEDDADDGAGTYHKK